MLHLRNLLPRSPPSSSSSGNALFLFSHHHVNNWKSCFQLEKTIRFFHNNQKRDNKKILSSLPSIDQLSNARVIYSVAPSMGHNQEDHPESHFRVPSIVNALGEMKLTPKFHGSEVVKLQHFEPATTDDIASVHARDYVSELEKVIGQGLEKGRHSKKK